MAEPSYQGAEPVPVVNAPPWIHTSTGRRASSHPGVQTFRVRQSSLIGRPSVPMNRSSGPRSCGAMGPYSVAGRTPPHAGGRSGGAKRSGPTGAAA